MDNETAKKNQAYIYIYIYIYRERERERERRGDLRSDCDREKNDR